MKCPTCNNLMIVVEYERIELDHCMNCLGVWFDYGELELLFDQMHLDGTNSALNNLFGRSEVKTEEKKGKCPICGKKMKKTKISLEPNVLVDVCNYQHGLWFDGGELVQLIKQTTGESVSGDANGHLIDFLSDAFRTESP